MINAKEARRRTLLNTKLKDFMSEIDIQINKAIERGDYHVRVTANGYSKELIDAVMEELELLGYQMEFHIEVPCPAGCRSDQWWDESYLRIDWEEE